MRADEQGRLQVGRSIELQMPQLQMPATRKNATGYFVAPEMDAIDLFIGSQGTLGVICEITARLLPKPEGLLSREILFENETDGLALVAHERAHVDTLSIASLDRESYTFVRRKHQTI